MRLYSERSKLHTRSPHAKRWEAHVGAAHVAVVVLLALSLLSAGLYVYAVNRSAVQGYAIRTLEKELKELKKANAELRVQEAEGKALSRVEAGSVDLRMERADVTTIVITPANTVAFR